MPKVKAEKGWAITGTYGLHTGWWQTRSEAIHEHCRGKSNTWSYCRSKGDRAVPVLITPIARRKK